MSSSNDDELSLERCAEALVYKAYYQPEDVRVIFQRLGVTDEQVERAGARLGAEIATGLGRGDAEAVMRFARAYSTLEMMVRSRRPSPSTVESQSKSKTKGSREVAPLPQLRKLPNEPSAEPVQSPPKGTELPSYLRQPNAEALRAESKLEPSPAPAAPAAPAVEPAPKARTAVELPAHILAAKGLRMSGTALIDDTAPKIPTLPFEAKAKRPPPPAPPPPPRTPTGTKEFPVPTPEVPFSKYVALCVELENGASQAEALARVGLSEVERSAAEAYWASRLTADPSVSEAFQSLRKQLLEKSQKGR